MAITAGDIAKQLPNAGVGSWAIEGRRVVLRSALGHCAWTEEFDGSWEIHVSNASGAVTPPQSAPEVARALVLAFQNIARAT